MHGGYRQTAPFKQHAYYSTTTVRRVYMIGWLIGGATLHSLPSFN